MATANAIIDGTVSQRAFACILAISILFAGCDSITALNGFDVHQVGRFSSRPAWSPDGRTIYYSDRAGGGITKISLYALNVASGGSRKLATVSALNHGEQLRTTVDPSVVFATIAQPNWSLQLNLYRVASGGGTLETIASNVGTLWFVVSADGRYAAYQGSEYDSDTIYVASTNPQQSNQLTRIPIVGRRPRVMSLSPTGNVIVYSSSGVYAARTAGSSAHQLIATGSIVNPTGEVVTSPDVIWSGDNPHLLIAEAPAEASDSVYVQDLNALTGERTVLGAIRSVLPDFRWQLARSADGQSFAAWVPVKIVNRNVERTTYRFRLYLKRPGHAHAVSALELDGDEPLTWFEFSADGSRLALMLKGSVYIVETD